MLSTLCHLLDKSQKSFDRQKSHILFTCKNFTEILCFPIYHGKKAFVPGNGGGRGRPLPFPLFIYGPQNTFVRGCLEKIFWLINLLWITDFLISSSAKLLTVRLKTEWLWVQICCSHLNGRYRACLEQEVLWHSGNYRV